MVKCVSEYSGRVVRVIELGIRCDVCILLHYVYKLL